LPHDVACVLECEAQILVVTVGFVEHLEVLVVVVEAEKGPKVSEARQSEPSVQFNGKRLALLLAAARELNDCDDYTLEYKHAANTDCSDLEGLRILLDPILWAVIEAIEGARPLQFTAIILRNTTGVGINRFNHGDV